MIIRDRFQEDRMEVWRGRGNGRAGGAGDLKDHLEAIGLAGSQVRRELAGERWEPSLPRWASSRSGDLPMAMGDIT